MGLELLDWLRTRTLPEEARLADTGYAREVARRFVDGLAANGTTTALVFGSHFPAAQEAFFEEAERARAEDRQRPRRLRPQPAAGAARDARRGLRGEPRARGALARTRAPALRGHPALLGVLHGGDARGVWSADARAARCAVHQPHQREPQRDRVRRRIVPLGARLPGHVRALRPGGCRIGLRPRRPRDRRRAGTAGGGAGLRRALPVEQRVPGQRHLLDAPPPRARRSLRPRHRCRGGDGPEPVQGGADGLPRPDGAGRGPPDRPDPPALPGDPGGRRGARARRGDRRPGAPAAAPTSCSSVPRRAARSKRSSPTARPRKRRSEPCSRSPARSAWPRFAWPASPSSPARVQAPRRRSSRSDPPGRVPTPRGSWAARPLSRHRLRATPSRLRARARGSPWPSREA